VNTLSLHTTDSTSENDHESASGYKYENPVHNARHISSLLAALAERNSALKSLFATLHVLFPTEFLPALDVIDRRLVRRFIVTDMNPTEDADIVKTINTSIDNDDNTELEMNAETTTMTNHNLQLVDGSPHERTRHATTDKPECEQSDESNNDPDPDSRRKDLREVYTYRVLSSHSHPSSWRDSTSRHALGKSHDRPDTTGQEREKSYHVRSDQWSCSCAPFTLSCYPISSPAQTPPGVGLTATNTHVTTNEEKNEWMVGGALSGKDTPCCKHLLACILIEKCPEMFDHGIADEEMSLEEYVGWSIGWGG